MNHPKKNPSSDGYKKRNIFAFLKRFNRNGCNRGYTIIELFIVIAIIGSIASISLSYYLRFRNEAKVRVAISNIVMIEKQILLYFVENDGLYPTNLKELSHINKIKDPWSHPYQYLRIDGSDIKGKGKIRRNTSDNPVNTDYDLYSMGADGQSQPQFKAKQSRDDIVRAYEGRYVGLVSELQKRFIKI